MHDTRQPEGTFGGAGSDANGGWPQGYQPMRTQASRQPVEPGIVPQETVPTQPQTPVMYATPQRGGGNAQAGAPVKPAERGFSRRTMLIGAGVGALGVGALGAGAGYLLTTRPAIPSIYASQAGQIGHLLRHAGFGPSPNDIGVYLDAGVQGSIDRLINYSAIASDLDAKLSALGLDFTKAENVIRWFTLRMIYSPRPLEEKMTLFWHGVLTSALSKIGGKQNFPLLIQQNKLLREKAMGRFDDLIHSISIDPAMLWWLDGRLSSGKAPNENYARELMELFTMGIGNYTQNDVHQGALALTGWTVRRYGSQSHYLPGRHYDGSVTFLGHTGPMGLDDVVRLVCAHPATGKHIAFRMWSFFVYDNPSDGDLKPLVDAYYSNDHSIQAVVRAMLTAPQFFSEKAYRARVKSPVEFVVGAVRGVGLQTNGTGLAAAMVSMGQTLFDPPNVSGWDGDKLSAAWVSTQAWMARVNFVNALVAVSSGMAPGGKKRSKSASIQASSVVQETINAQHIGSAEALVDYYVAALLDSNIGADRRAMLHNVIAQEAGGGQTLTLSGGGKVSALGVRNALYLLMSMPEFHLN